jgi:hypothetical protein
MALVAPTLSRAAVIVAETTDAEISIDGATGDGDTTAATVAVGNLSSDDLRIGAGGSGAGTLNISGVFAYKLPALGPGQVFDTASLSFNLTAKNGTVTGFNADLYVLGARSTNAPVGTDAYVGVFNGDPTNAVALEDNFFTNATATGVKSTSASANAALVALLNNLYATDPNAADKYLFVRLSPDADPPNGATNRYRVSQADAGITANVANRPSLTYTTVPEPTGLALVAGAGLLTAARRRRRSF